MKRVIAFSDSHGNAEALKQAVNQARSMGQIDVAVFLGDGIRDFQNLLADFSAEGTVCKYIAGNNDFFSPCQQEEVFFVDKVCFYICHGHQWGVKYSLDRLQYAAEERGADICLFGHTHIPYRDVERGIWYMNPGAVGWSLPGKPAYAEILIDKDGTIDCKLINLIG